MHRANRNRDKKAIAATSMPVKKEIPNIRFFRRRIISRAMRNTDSNALGVKAE